MKCASHGCDKEACCNDGFCKRHHMHAIRAMRRYCRGWADKSIASYPEYKVWQGIKSRCYREKDRSYPFYGAKGIKVCDAWLHSFETFYKDVGPRPGPQYELDREDPDGDYCPENCRWLLGKENRRRKRGVKLNTEMVALLRKQYRDSGQSMLAFAKEVGMNYLTVRSALIGINWLDVPDPIQENERLRRGPRPVGSRG